MSEAFDAVVAAEPKPLPECGGPCATCAFRSGTEANQTDATVMLARLCVEGLEQFYCHEKSQLCRGWIAAVNLQYGGAPLTDEDRRRVEVARAAADILSNVIDAAVVSRDGGGQ